MSDLSFRGREEVRVLGGSEEFRPIPGPEGMACFMAGTLSGGEGEQAATTSSADAFGRFVLLTHDPARRSLSIECDRHGFLPLYTARASDALLFSTRLGRLSECGEGGLDTVALADFLAFGFCLGERTLVPGVASFEAGTRVRVDLDTLEIATERLWDPIPRLRDGSEPLAQAHDELIDLFLEGVDRCVQDGPSVALTLSGGLDTRCIAAAMAHRGLAPVAYHVGVPGSRATRYTTGIAAACGIPLRCFAPDAEFSRIYPDLVEEVVRLTEGMKFAAQTEMLWLRNQVENGPVMLHGAYGEIAKLEALRDFRVDAATQAAGRAGLADVLWQRFGPRLRARLELFSADFRAELEPHPRLRLDQLVESVDGALDDTQALQALYLREFPKTARYGHLVWNARVPTRFPFIYPPFVDRLLEVRAADRMTPAFQRVFLERVGPKLLELPDDNTGAHVNAPRAWTALIQNFGRVRSVLSATKAGTGHNDLLTWIAGAGPRLEELVATSDPGLYDRARIRGMIASVRETLPSRGLSRARRIRSARRHAEALEAFLVLESWRRSNPAAGSGGSSVAVGVA